MTELVRSGVVNVTLYELSVDEVGVTGVVAVIEVELFDVTLVAGNTQFARF